MDRIERDENFRVIIAGSRGFNDYEYLRKFCDNALVNKTNIEVVSGGTRGADRLGERYANEKGYPIRRFIPDWNVGKSAGYIRNTEMAKYGNALIAFWDGRSKGTGHMIDIARAKGLQIKIATFTHIEQ